MLGMLRRLFFHTPDSKHPSPAGNGTPCRNSARVNYPGHPSSGAAGPSLHHRSRQVAAQLLTLARTLGRELLLRLWLRLALATSGRWLRRRLGLNPHPAVPALLLRSSPPRASDDADYDSDESYRRFLEEHLARDSAAEEERDADYDSDASYDRFLAESNRAAGLTEEFDYGELFPSLPRPNSAPDQPEAFGGGETPAAAPATAAETGSEASEAEIQAAPEAEHRAPEAEIDVAPEAQGQDPAAPVTPEAEAPPIPEAPGPLAPEARDLLEEIDAAARGAEERIREILATAEIQPKNPLHRSW